MARRQREHDLVGAERLVDEAAVRLLGADDAELELVREHALGDVLRRADGQRDLDLGC